MYSTYYNFDQIPKRFLMQPYIKTKHEVLPLKGFPKALYHNPSAVLYSTSNDLIKFIQFNLRNYIDKKNSLIYSTCYDLLWRPLVETPYKPNTHYGIGWFLGRLRKGDDGMIVGHGGREYGFNSLMLIYPKKQIGMVLLMNTHYANTLKIAGKILMILTKGCT